MSLYQQRGVSAQKEEVHAATAALDKGLFPHAFCKVYPDYLGGDDQWINVMHADGAGTKSILAYLYWKETGDLDVWKGIAQDAIVMNIDDLLCVGIHDQFLFSSTIDRNKTMIPGEVLQAIIHGTQAFFDQMSDYGVNIRFMGGETADVGDVVRTIAVNGTMTARWPLHATITNEHIQPGDVIVGLASFGRCAYEQVYNSGIGSNGLTSARHDALAKYYADQYPETYDPSLAREVVYIGAHRMTDLVGVSHGGILEQIPVGKLLLSPTRTYLPLMQEVLKNHFHAIHGLIHNSGGGLTKVLKYVGDNVRIIKDNLFDPPPVFPLLQAASGADAREMSQVFNMGQRLEIYTSSKDAPLFLDAAARYGIEARVIGRVEAASKKELVIRRGEESIVF
ncbi:AIR synthase-related protein [Dinghuibacter silviterrae]|uniref:Phosphoribosylformylglycinamidine cyclo-ligase n=1 Tax=Dinghuibacter silviterrae TaxID=1539049 RepID=A0A4R8DTM1_9BACT|nr:AIR synthase-related protein [Dinghuibacter silviterrae]TDX01650.1 phosphoribosylformylglycinamidine cyclo-ligase [Dinghuibacter silviterrae]